MKVTEHEIERAVDDADLVYTDTHQGGPSG